MAILKRIKSEPKKKFVLVYLIAGHGIQTGGLQTVVINEFDEKTRFYKIWGVESDIRDWTENNANVYIVCFFACCRELHNATRHSGCYGGTLEEAQKKFDVDEEARQKQLQEDNDKARLGIDLANALKENQQLKAALN